MHNKSQAYSAIDIARLLVRNPDEVIDFLSYDRICNEICNDRPIEGLSKEEKDSLFSLEAGFDDLCYLGFNRDQLEIILEAYKEAYDASDIDEQIPEYVFKTAQERIYLTAFTIAAFPYGPPIILREPYNIMASKGFTLSQTRSSLDRLTTLTAQKLMDKREQYPKLLIVEQSRAPKFDYLEPS